MRFLSLGFALPGPRMDNYSFASAPSFFDYDAIIVDPAALSRLIETLVDGEEQYHTHFEEPVGNGLTTPERVGLADLLRRRQEETARLLAARGIVVCFAYPDVAHPRVAGFTGCDRYFWLPAPPGMQYREPYLLPAEGTEVAASDLAHPFAPYVEAAGRHIGYRARFAEDVAGFSRFGRVFARTRGGAAVGVQLSAGGGTVVFLPALYRPPTGEPRYRLSDVLQECVVALLQKSGEELEPPWAADVELPGLAERRAALADAESAVEAARAELAGAESAVRDLTRHVALLWQAGPFGLGQAVRDALAALGFTVAGEPGAPIAASIGSRTLLVEAEGADTAVGMDAHYRLRARLEEAIASTGEPARGALVVNGYRLRPPADRPQQYEDSVRVAAESMRYCLLTSADLFDAVRAALAGDEQRVAAFREGLYHTDGVLGTGTPPLT